MRQVAVLGALMGHWSSLRFISNHLLVVALGSVLGALAGCGDRGQAAPVWGYDVRPVNRTCLAPPRPVQNTDVVLVEPFDVQWTRATSMVQPPGQPDWWWVTTARGEIRRFRNVAGVADDELVADLSSLIASRSIPTSRPTATSSSATPRPASSRWSTATRAATA